MPVVAWGPLVLFLLILWATTGLTIIHLGVLGARFVRGRFARRGTRPVPLERPPPANLSLTFLVPVYNDAATLGPTIESLLRQTIRPDRILVVDDGSTDGTAAVLDDLRDRGVDVMHLPVNVGKTRALDVALRTVTTDLVAITDADSIVHHAYVEEALRSFHDADLVAVGGAVESIPHTWVTAARQLEYMMTVRIDRDAESTMGALVVLPGVSTTYRTHVLREMGFEFDTIAEDFDMTFRLQRAGKKIGMNLRAKVYTSDPPTLRAYYKQLSRWYTDFWLVIRKHRRMLGKRVFGTLEVPLLVTNTTISSVLYLTLPFWLAWHAPRQLVTFFLTGLAADFVLVTVAWRLYRRNDVWWALVSRVPTRVISRAAYLIAMTRVLVGRPGLAWTKLERRRTDAFLSASAATARSRPFLARDGTEGALWWVGVVLALVGGLVLPLAPAVWTLLALGLGILSLRGVSRALSRARGPARVAALLAVEMGFVAVIAVALRLMRVPWPDSWRVGALVVGLQVVIAALAWPTLRALWRQIVSIVGHASTLGSVMALVAGVPTAWVAVGCAAGFALVTLASAARSAGWVVATGAAALGLAACAWLALPGAPALVAQGALGIAVASAGASLAMLAAPPRAQPVAAPQAPIVAPG